MNGITGPEEAHGVHSPEEWRTDVVRFLVRHGRRAQVVPSIVRPAAYVSHGRWVCQCPNPDCQNGPSASREWGIAICYECGWECRPIFPYDAEQAEKVLSERLTVNRSYFPDALVAVQHGVILTDEDLNIRGETVADLRAENTQKQAQADADPNERIRQLEAQLRAARGEGV